jgi:hypothetical protein
MPFLDYKLTIYFRGYANYFPMKVLYFHGINSTWFYVKQFLLWNSSNYAFKYLTSRKELKLKEVTKIRIRIEFETISKLFISKFILVKWMFLIITHRGPWFREVMKSFQNLAVTFLSPTAATIPLTSKCAHIFLQSRVCGNTTLGTNFLYYSNRYFVYFCECS